MKKIAVIGSGVMGSGIASVIANAGFEVMLLDMPAKEGDKNQNVLKAKELMLKTKPAPLLSPKRADLISVGNLEDDFAKLADFDWIIEVIIENLAIKQNLYEKIEKIKKIDAVVSSNTSTLPLAKLLENRGENFRKNFLITHFFNPPRYMKLLELVTHDENDEKMVKNLSFFIEHQLGKIIVPCKDSPGFIANRIGCFWLETGLKKALKFDANLQKLDEAIVKIFSLPKTGIFGLWDLIGLDLMPLIANSLIANLPENDAFCVMYEKHAILEKMIKEGNVGRKGKGGFFRMVKNADGQNVKQVISLKTGEYSDIDSTKAEYVKIEEIWGEKNLSEKFALEVMVEMLNYSLVIAQDVARDVNAIDLAMKAGYNWQFGPFEMIDKIGANLLAEHLTKNGRPIPKLLSNVLANGGKFFNEESFFNFDSKFEKIAKRDDVIKLATLKEKPILENDSAALWDLGDEVACLEFKTKMNVLNEEIFDLMIKIAEENLVKALVIGGDSENFCAGADLKCFHENLVNGDFDKIENFITKGQKAMMSLKKAKFPVVAAAKGFALGGGAEILLHAHAICVHSEIKAGLVERKVGLIPGWGGTKETILRGLSFANIISSKISESADDLIEMGFMKSGLVVMNEEFLLIEAKNLALKMRKEKFEAKKEIIKLPKSSKTQDEYENSLLEMLEIQGEITEEALLCKEKEIFMKNIRLPETLQKMAKFLK